MVVACPDSLVVEEASCAMFCWDMLRGSGSTTDWQKGRKKEYLKGQRKARENMRRRDQGGSEEIARGDRERRGRLLQVRKK